MDSNLFKIGETVVVDEEEHATIVQLYSLRAEGSNRLHDMARVRMEDGEVREYFLVDLGRIVEPDLFARAIFD